MLDFIKNIENPISQALIASLFTWGMTACGAALVFFLRDQTRNCSIVPWVLQEGSWLQQAFGLY